MANSTEGESIFSPALQASTLITLISGLVIHSFIIGINVNNWWKGRSVTSVDHIISSVAISRMCAHSAITLHLLAVRRREILTIISRVYGFFIFGNIWITSLLSIVFYLKISNLQTRLFLHLRGMIVQRTVHLIVACGCLSALCSLMYMFIYRTKVTISGTYNTTMHNLITSCIDIKAIYSFAIGASIPLLFYYISSILLFASLHHHTVKMKRSSNLSINLETYYSAMKFVSFTFIYTTIYFIGHFVLGYFYSFFCSHPRWLYVVVEFLPTLHSSYVIYRTSKLRSQISKVLQNVSDFLFQCRETEIRENIGLAAQ